MTPANPEHSVTLLTDIGLGIIFAALASHLAKALRQPLILGYVLGGVLLGSHLGFGLIANEESIELISEIGLIFLLFIIGLEINLRELISMGKAMFTLGFVQFTVCVGIGMAGFQWMGFKMGGKNFDLLYIAVALALSSTLIVVKLLNDKHEVNTVSGRLTIGVLVLQDIWAIVFMAFQPNLQNPQIATILKSLGLGIVLIGLSFTASRYILGKLFHASAKSPELVLLTSIAWCFSVCGLAEEAGLSKEMGALIAGMSIAAFPYGADVIAKLTGVRDFFVTLFFVSLGLKVPIPTWELAGLAGVAALVVLFSRLLSVAPVVYLLNKGLRNGLVTAFNLSQISEFSLVIIALGAGYGHISKGLSSFILSSMILTSILSTYMIQYNDRLARIGIRILSLLGLKEKGQKQEAGNEQESRQDIVVLGCFRTANVFLDAVEKHSPELMGRVLVIDYNPELGEKLKGRGFNWSYGDLAHAETLQHIGIKNASVIICSISNTFLKGTTNQRLLTHLKRLAPDARLIMSADESNEAEKLIKEGADEVLVPSQLTGAHLFELVATRFSQ